MQTVKQGFNRFLLRHFIKYEGIYPTWGFAFSIYLPFHKTPAARIEVISHLESCSCEIVYFYVCKKWANQGCGRMLLERVEHFIALYGIKKITVEPIGITSKDLPRLTRDELLTIYKRLGFVEQEGKKRMVKML